MKLKDAKKRRFTWYCKKCSNQWDVKPIEAVKNKKKGKLLIEDVLEPMICDSCIDKIGPSDGN